MATISDIIKSEVKRYIKEEGVKSAYDINNGLCEEFMQDIIHKVPGADELTTMNFTDINGNIIYKGKRINLPDHSWITYKKKHYDAETPNGVTDFMDLKMFKKAQGRSK